MASTKGVDWQYKIFPSLDLGLNKTVQPYLLEDGEAVTAKNVRFQSGVVTGAYGYTTVPGEFSGEAQQVNYVEFPDGTALGYMITTKGFYTFDGVRWKPAGDGFKTTITTAAIASDTVALTSVTGLVVGDPIAVEIAENGWAEANIVGISGLDVTLDKTVTVDAGGKFLRRGILNGDVKRAVSSDVWEPENAVLFVNTTDVPKVYKDGVLSDISGLDDITGATSEVTNAQIIRVLYNQVILFGTTEDGTYIPVRVRVSTIGDYTVWNDSGANTGTFYDLLDGYGRVIAAEVLGPYMILYRNLGISRMEYVGQSFQLWRFSNLFRGDTAISKDAVIEISGSHVVFGKSSFFTYSNGYSVQEIDEKIRDAVFGDLGELAKDPEKAERSFVMYNTYFDEVWFFVNQDKGEFPTLCMRGKLEKNMKWSMREFPLELTSAVSVQLVVASLWNNTPGTWEDFTFTPWLKLLAKRGRPAVIFGSLQDGKILQYDFVARQEESADVRYLFETKLLKNLEKTFRLDRIDFEYKGSSCTVSISKDAGNSFQTLTTIENSDTYKVYSVHVQDVVRDFLVRFDATGEDFNLKWAASKIREEGENDGLVQST